MPQRRDSKGRFLARKPLVWDIYRAPDGGKAWDVQVAANNAAAGRPDQERRRRRSLTFRQRCLNELAKCRRGQEGERKQFLLPITQVVRIRTGDLLSPKAPETFEAIFAYGKWRPILDSRDREQAGRYAAKIERRNGIQFHDRGGDLHRAIEREAKARLRDGYARLNVPPCSPARPASPASPASPAPVPAWERNPEDRPYDWWARLPFCEDDELNEAIDRAVRRAHPHWRSVNYSKRYRLALLGGGSFRDVFHVLTAQGYDTGLIVKKPTLNHRNDVKNGTALHRDNGNGSEAAVYRHLTEFNPTALECFPVLYETEPTEGRWAIHEKVRPDCFGRESIQDLEGHWSSAGVMSNDLHVGNIGRRDSDRRTLVTDYGHFTVRDLLGIKDVPF